MTLQQLQAVPPGFTGSLPEYIVLRTLGELGRRENVDFTFQSALFGGRLERGGLVVDFLFTNPPDLAINVQGVFFHQEQGAVVVARDRYTRAQLAGAGINLIFIDEDDALENARYYVQEALQYRDHSVLGGVGG